MFLNFHFKHLKISKNLHENIRSRYTMLSTRFFYSFMQPIDAEASLRV
jgi:hypothetical protein